MTPSAARTIALLVLSLGLGWGVAAPSPVGAQDTAAGAESEAPPSLEERVREMETRQGLLTLHLDAEAGRVWLEVPPATAADGTVGEYLYVEGLVTGLGSNPVGLDRGQLGPARLVALRRQGGRLLVEQRNLAYRALSEDPAERRAVVQSFATSVLWAGALESPGEDGRALVDLTSFVVRDAHDVAGTLARTGQGRFRLDPDRSAVDLDACLVFPDNLELEALLTWSGEEPGEHVRSTAPSPSLVTLVQHHSLIRLPEPGYRPREFHPRSGSFAISFHDYAAPLEAPLERRWIVRHRLEKTDPGAESSPVVEPLVYHVDRGAPEPVRQALVEGASWWADAFAAAGLEDAFRVELLPEDAHPLDVRYNVIQWVHRSTRGWSYGGGIVDPRTGEMIKGHVTLGSLRVRQDRLIFEGLAGTAKTGTGADDDPVELALARIRQLSAHEVGHTLGLAHNFAASTYGRASVMDYPAPLVELDGDGNLDFSHAYGVGVGAWDVQAVRYAYSQLPPGADEAAALEAIIADGIARGLEYFPDPDARPPGSAQPLASLWDNGAEPVAELERLAAVRRAALDRFGVENVAPGRPLALLHEALVPIYLLHRFQVQAAAKVVGGLDYEYAHRGDGSDGAARLLEPERQRRALTALLDLTSPEALDLPEELLLRLLPRPFGYPENRELFRGNTGVTFDLLAAAATAADLVLQEILHPARMARVVDHHRRDAAQPSLEEVLDSLVTAVFTPAPDESARQAEIRRVVEAAAVRRLIDLSETAAAVPGVRARVDWRLESLAGSLVDEAVAGAERAHRKLLGREIDSHLGRRPEGAPSRVAAEEAPPGQPIGAGLPEPPAGCSVTGFQEAVR